MLDLFGNHIVGFPMWWLISQSFYLDFSSSGETTDSPRKRKLSTGEGGDEDDNYIAMEEVVFVTEPEVNSSESTVKVAGILTHI